MSSSQKTIPGGLLIAFDGIDGCGKTTQLNLVAKELSTQNYQVYKTRNLGGSPIGEELRSALLKTVSRPPLTDLYVSAAIQEALIEPINNERAKGSIILLDRSPLSLVAYQSFGSGVSEELGWKFADSGIEKLNPDLIFVYDIDPNVAIERARNHSGAADYFEEKPIEYFDKVSNGFNSAAERYSAVAIDANTTIENLYALTIGKVNELLALI